MVRHGKINGDASQDDSDPPLPPIGDLADESAPVMTEVPFAQILGGWGNTGNTCLEPK